MNDIAHIDQPRKGKLLARFADRFGVDESKLISALKSTAFKVSGSEPTNEQMMALLVVADQYKLNPWTKEIYAFPDKGGIVPVVGVDGWARIINEHPQFDGMDFEQDAESCTCVIYRKDRAHPIRITEWMEECARGTGPWKSHPRRMLRHKAMIQCARVAFGFAGIYDQDEAERIAEAEQAQPGRIVYSDDRFAELLPQWSSAVRSGKKTPDQIIELVQRKADLTPEQVDAIKSLGAIDGEIVDE